MAYAAVVALGIIMFAVLLVCLLGVVGSWCELMGYWDKDED